MSAPSPDDQIRHYLETLEAAPGDSEAFAALEALFQSSQRYEDLVKLYEGRARLVPERTAAPGLLAKAAELAHHQLRNATRAEDLYRLLLHADPGHAVALRSVVELAEERGDWPAVAEALEREADQTVDTRAAAEFYLRLGKIQEEKLGRRDRAALFYGRASRMVPGLSEARSRALSCIVSLRRWAHAKRMLDAARIAGAEPKALAAEYGQLGALLADEPLDHGLAVEALIEALALDRGAPGAAPALQKLKATPRTWREQAKALTEQAGEARDRREAALLWLRGAELHAAYDADAATRVPDLVDRSWALWPGSALTLDFLERWYGEREDWRGLEASLKRLFTATRDRAALVALELRLAQLDLVRFGDPQLAVVALEEALDLDPACEQAGLQAFEIHVDAGRIAQALSVLERHFAAAPAKPQRALLRLRAAELALAALGDKARARRHLEAAMREDPAFAPAAAALAPLVAEAGEWRRFVEVLEAQLAAEPRPEERVRFLEQIAEVQATNLASPREGLRQLARALQLDPRRALTRKAMETAAAQSGAFLDLARAYRAAAQSARDDPKTRKALLRRVAEIHERDLEQPDEALKAYRAIVQLDPEDKGAAAALEACLARGGQHAGLASELAQRMAATSGGERRALAVKLARLYQLAGEHEAAAAAWREAVALRQDEPEALRGLAGALEMQGGRRAAEQLLPVLARLVALGGPDRAELEIRRAEILIDPLDRPAEAATAWLGVLRAGGLSPGQTMQAAVALEALLARGIEPVRIAQALAPLYAAQGDAAKHVAMLELLARRLPEGADPRERARLLLDAASIRAERLDDPRGALDAAAAALRASPTHAEARRRCEQLAAQVGAFGELFALLVETAKRFEGSAEDERTMRLRAAQLAEQELGSTADAEAQLRRVLEISPSDPEALAGLTRVALAAERWEEACDLLLERARTGLPPERLALLGQLADTLLERLKSHSAAAEVYRQALELAPPEQRPRLLARLARALELSGDFEAQARVLQDLAAATPDPAESARFDVERARVQERHLGDRLAAVESYRAALERSDTDHPEPLASLDGLLDDPSPEVSIAAARVLLPIYEREHQPRKTIRALEVEARLAGDPTSRAAAWRRIGRIQAEDLRQPALGFGSLVQAVRALPADPDQRRELRALGEESHSGEECARLYDEILPQLHGEAQLGALRELADWCERQLDDRKRAVATWERVRKAAAADPEALSALRRLYRAGERWAELYAVCLDLAGAVSSPAERSAIWREAAGVAEAKLGDPGRAAEAWNRVLGLEPEAGDAAAALERLYGQLDRPADLAALLERRRASASGDVELTYRLAELARNRLDDPAKALALHAEVLRADPVHAGARQALVALARVPGPIGREALAMTDALLRALGEHAQRVEAREGRLSSIDEPGERARLFAEIRGILEAELGQPAQAFTSACRAFAEGGRAREETLADLVRLAETTGSFEGLAQAYDDAAALAEGAEALDLRRRAARLREQRLADGAAAVAAWRRVLQLVPEDGEALEALDRLYTQQKSGPDLLEVTRRRAALAGGTERIGHLLHAGDLLAATMGDATGAEAAYREVLAFDPHNVNALEALERLFTRQRRSEELAGVLLDLAEALRSDPPRRIAVLLRRSAILERAADPRPAIEIYAQILAESPLEPGAVAGLERLVAEPATRDLAARLLEDVYRGAGDARKLVAVLGQRLESADASERLPLLAEVSALYERLGQRPEAYLAKARQYRETLQARGDETIVTSELERLAAETGAFESLAATFEAALSQGLAPERATELKRRLAGIYTDRHPDLPRAAHWLEEVAAGSPSPEVFGALARIYRRQSAFRELADVYRRQAAMTPAPAARKDLLFEVATIMENHLSDREGAIEAYRKILAVDPEDPNALRLLGRLLGTTERWDELAAVLGREVSAADQRPNFVAEAAELRYRLGRVRQQRLADADGALECYRGVLEKAPRHPAALAALEEMARGAGPAALTASEILEPIYLQEGEHRKLIDALEARLPGLESPAERAALLRRISGVFAGPLKNPEMAFLAASRAMREDPNGLETLDLALDLAESASLQEEVVALLDENAERPREPAGRAEYRRRLARLYARSGGEPQRAADEWQRVLEFVPDDAEALEGLTHVHRSAGAGEPLAQVLRRRLGIEEDPVRRAGLLSDLAQVQDERLRDAAGALFTLKRLLELEPKSRDALSRLDRLCVRSEKWIELADALGREIAVADEAHDPGAALAFRFRLAELKESRLLDREGALSLYEEILTARPDHAETIARLEALLAKGPSNVRAASLLEKAYGAAGNWQKYAAVLDMRAGERPDPLERKALFIELAEVREKRLGNAELAFLSLCRAFRDDPSDARLRVDLERLADATEHHEELAAIYEDELDRIGPAGAPVCLKLGQIHEEKLGGPEEALRFIERARSLDPSVAPQALPMLDRLYRKLERWPQLADVIVGEVGLETRPEERAALLFRLGQLCDEKLQAPDRATAAFEAILGQDPRHGPGLRALERLYEAAGRQEALLGNLSAQRQVAADTATRERITVKMAQVAATLGRDAEAVELWRDVVAQQPRHEQALAALEGLYEKLERWPELAEVCRAKLAVTVDRRETARLNDKLGWLLGVKLGDAAQAVQSFKAVLDSDPRNKRALEALRDIYTAQGERDSLAGIYRRLIPLQEDAAGVREVRIKLAEVLLAGEQKQEAVEQAKRAFDIEGHTAADLSRLQAIFEAAGAVAEGVRASEARAALFAAEGRTGDAVEAWCAVADVWLRQAKPENAAAALEKAMELEPGRRPTYERLREIYAQSGGWRAYARVCEHFLPQLEDRAERIALLEELGGIHEKRLGQKEMAFLAWCRAFQEDPSNADVQVEVDRLAAETEAFDELAGVYEQVAEESRGPTKARLLLALGRVRDEKLDDLEGAEAALRKALDADPASPEALDALASLFTRRGRVRDLVITLEQKLEAAAGLDEKKATLLEVAKLYDGEMHDVQEAVSALRRVLELDGGDSKATQGLAALYRREQRWSDLAGLLARARDLAPDGASRVAYQLQIAALYENEIADDEAAVEAYRAVVGLDDLNPEALAGLERLYTKLDRFAELNRVYEREAEIAQDEREKIRILSKSAGIWEEKLQNSAKAIERNEQILQIDGGNLPAVKGLERLYRQEGMWEKLIAVAQHHVSLISDRREMVALEIAIGEVWWKELQRVDRAEAIFNHALQLDPDSRDAMNALGRLYERSGNWNLALEMLRREARIAAASKDAVDIHARMGRIHEEMLLDVPAAKEAYGRALDLDPSCLTAIRALKGIFETERNRDGYLEMLVAESRYVEDDAEKARLLHEVGRLYQEERDDKQNATRYYEEALRRAPDFLPAARPLSDIYVAASTWDRAERVLDVIVGRLSQEGDTRELCRQSYRLGYVAEKLGKRDKALGCYRRAYELDATYLPALEGLGNLLVQEKAWEEALRIFQAILIHHRDDLTDLEVVETYWQIGEIQAQVGQPDRAVKSFDKALEMDANHEPSRRSLVRLLEAAGDWERAVEHRQRLASLLEGKARFEQYVAIGAACRDQLKDPYQAIDAYMAASRIDPTDLSLTEALLGLYRETRQGQKASDVLQRILERPEVQADAIRAAKLHLALAEILRDEVKDEEAALAELEKALDKNPRLVQAFSAVEAMLSAGKKWQALEQAYVRMIQRLPKAPELQQARIALWKTLGELYRRVLDNADGARMAYEVVVKADPEDAAAVEVYGDLAAKKPGQESQAIEAYRQLLRTGAKPQKAVSALVGLHAARKEYDKAYTAAQVLVHLLGQASSEEQQVVSKLQRFARDMASRSLDETMWREHLLHEKVRGPLAEIMRIIATEAGSLFTQNPKDLGLVPKRDEIDLQGSMLFFVNMYKYVGRTLAMERLRLFKTAQNPGRLLYANTDPPAVVAGEELFKERPKKELWFSIGKVMTFARPELRMARLMPHDQLDVVFQAACNLGTSRFVVTVDPHLVQKLKHRIEKALPEKTRAQTLKKLARQYCEVQQAGDVRAYMDGAELSSNRVGALLAGDLSIARKMVLGERAQVSKLRDETKLRDLAQFCVSDDYALLRERLGLSVVVPG